MELRDGQPYGIPFRWLDAAHDNLLMAGKHIRVTYVAGSSVKLMGDGAQHGVAVAATAHLRHKYDTTPWGLFDGRLDELRGLVERRTGHEHDPSGRKFVAQEA